MKSSTVKISDIRGRDGFLTTATSAGGITVKANNESLARRLLAKKVAASRRTLYGKR
jgi:hypothetical protein